MICIFQARTVSKPDKSQKENACSRPHMFCKEVGLTSQQSGFSGFDNIGIIFNIIKKDSFWA